MKEAFIKKSFNYIQNHRELNHYQELKIKYGLEVMYHFFTKYTVIILLSIIFNIYNELLLITILYMPLRLFGHGIHSNSNKMCWFTSVISLLTLSYISKFINVNIFTTIYSVIIGLISFSLWAPSDTPSRPLISKSKRTTLKIKILITTLVYLFIALFFKNLSTFVVIAIIIEVLNINPVIYFINHVPRNNYVGIERS